MTEKNPYTEMTESVLTEHLKQLKTVVEEKKIDVSQYFGASLSDDDKTKLKQYDSLSAQVKELSTAAASKNLSDNEVRLSQASIDVAVNDLRKLDPHVPLDQILDSNFNNIEKLDILNGVKPIVEHSMASLETLRKEIPQSGTEVTGTQKFQEPKPGDETAAEIIEQMIKANKED